MEASKVEEKPQTTLTKRGTKVPCYAEKTDEEFEIKQKKEESDTKPKAVTMMAKGKAKARPGRTGVFGRRGGPKLCGWLGGYYI